MTIQSINGIPDRRLGSAGLKVFPLAIGCMGMGKAALYGESDEAESIRAIHAAVDFGITLFDTGDFYGMGQNELLLQRALSEMAPSSRERVQLSVKFGAMRAPNGTWLGADCRPITVKNALAQSLSKLGVDHIDIYRPARLDDSVPIEDTVGAIAEMVKQGYVRYVGLSEVSISTVRRALGVTPICDMQIEYGIATRGIEASILPGLRELAVGVTAYGVLSRGLLSGSKPQARGDFRKFLPRFTGTNLSKNEALVSALREIAEERGSTVVKMAIAWVLAQGSDIVPVLGCRTVAQVTEAIEAATIHLAPEEMKKLEAAIPGEQVAGARYDKHSMAHLDSER
ncbi:aldo/keto reductase [Granulicella arctica]|uniref:aldo/keto reductase n=1 Tax=Granulicella arctica TaxID=940613 RepID=UPI0021E09C1D|nr:aldo/keto reductase [Granulicella arctica]